MKLHTKLLVAFGSLWSVLVLATVVVLFLLNRQSVSLEDALHSNFDSVDYCGQMVDAIDAYNQLAMTAMAGHAAIPQEAVAEAQREFEKGAESQRHNITLPGEGELTSAAIDRAAEFQRAFAIFAAANEQARDATYHADVFPRYLAAHSAIQAVIDLNYSHLRTMNGDLQRNLSEARGVHVLFVFIGAVSAIASILVLRKTILGPLHALTESARQVEAGNLDLAVPVRAMDELGVLAMAFNAMASKLQEYRKLDAARLRRTQQTTQLAIDSLPDAVAVFNPAGEVEISNHQARVHFGLEPGKRAEAVDAEGGQLRPEWLRELLTSALESGRAVEPRGYETAVQLFDAGEERFLLPRAVPMFSEGGGAGNAGGDRGGGHAGRCDASAACG